MDQLSKKKEQHTINLKRLQVQEEKLIIEQQRIQQQQIDLNTKREQLDQQKQNIAMQKLEEEGIIRELERQEKEKEAGGASSFHMVNHFLRLKIVDISKFYYQNIRRNPLKVYAFLSIKQKISDFFYFYISKF